MDTTKTTLGALVKGDKVNVLGTLREVLRVEAARARGYVVVTFTDGTRESGHRLGACWIVTKSRLHRSRG